jgi:hypothetical protein
VAAAGALLFEAEAGGLQVQPRVPNELGSALVGDADTTATLRATAAVSKSFGINFDSR